MPKHGKDTKILLGAVDVSGFFTSYDSTGSVESHETTTFGKQRKTRIPGLADGSATMQGLWDGAVLAIDEILSATLGVAGQILTAGRNGLAAIGDRAELLKALHSNYQRTSPVNDVVSLSATLEGDGGLDNGVVLHPLAAEVATGTSANVDHGAATANGGVAHLHVTAKAGTAPTLQVKVQHSVDNSVWVDLVTFATLNDVLGAERVEVAAGTTVNRHTRAQRTIGGTGGPSWTHAVAFARR